MNRVSIAVNICTYKREKYIKKITDKIEVSLFCRNDVKSRYFGFLQVYIIDNGCELEESDSEFIHLIHNPRGNVGGSGGYQYGIEVIRNAEKDFTHVVFMDDDVEFDISCFYKLFDFLQMVDKENADRPVAGRMFRMDNRQIQYTAAEIWNAGNIRHVGLNKSIEEIQKEPDVEWNSGAEYGGWWFCCFPYEFVRENDVLPFFIHCDDVEYGLRCGRPPIIIKGVQVWHETFEHRQTPIMLYYDTRNPLFVNEVYGLDEDRQAVLDKWKQKISLYHVNKDFISEYYVIKAMDDYLKGLPWLYKVDPARNHSKLQKTKIYKVKNSVLWRIVVHKYRRKYKM